MQRKGSSARTVADSIEADERSLPRSTAIDRPRSIMERRLLNHRVEDHQLCNATTRVTLGGRNHLPTNSEKGKNLSNSSNFLEGGSSSGTILENPDFPNEEQCPRTGRISADSVTSISNQDTVVFRTPGEWLHQPDFRSPSLSYNATSLHNSEPISSSSRTLNRQQWVSHSFSEAGNSSIREALPRSINDHAMYIPLAEPVGWSFPSRTGSAYGAPPLRIFPNSNIPPVSWLPHRLPLIDSPPWPLFPPLSSEPMRHFPSSVSGRHRRLSRTLIPELDEGNAQSVRDDHRGMRLNVDDMSYEVRSLSHSCRSGDNTVRAQELLDLEERIGNVSTGLQEADILKLMKREEYDKGDNLGVLDCGHTYHFNCIKQWLVLKNLCPVCKMNGLAL